eukprot:gene31869-7077_t
MRSPRSPRSPSMHSHGTRTVASSLSFQFSQMSRKTGLSSSPFKLHESLASGGAQEKAAIIFRKHDVNQDNFLNRDEMLAALQEVGVLNGIRAKQVGRFLEKEFKKADRDKDGKVSLADFASYYEMIAHYQWQMAREGRIKAASHNMKVPSGVENNPALKRVFKNYCKFALGQGRKYGADAVLLMTAQQFHRLCQDAGLVEPEGRLPTTAIDIIFYRYRPNMSRRLGYTEFLEALGGVSYESGMHYEDIMEALGCFVPLDGTDGSGSESGGMPAGVAHLSSFKLGHEEHSLLESINEVPIKGAAARSYACASAQGSAVSAAQSSVAASRAKPTTPTKKAAPVKKALPKKKKAVPGGAAYATGVPVGRATSNPLFDSMDVGAMRAVVSISVWLGSLGLGSRCSWGCRAVDLLFNCMNVGAMRAVVSISVWLGSLGLGSRCSWGCRAVDLLFNCMDAGTM